MLTEQDIVSRRSRIGSSDVAAILGLPTFAGKNAYTVWCDKCDMLEPEDEAKKPWLDAGNRLEPVILDYAESELGPLRRGVTVFDPNGAPIASMLDGQVIDGGRPVEAKTSGILGPVHGHWGDEGTDEVPDTYIVQAQVHLLCTVADVCPLFAMLPGRWIVWYDIEPIQKLHAMIRNVSTDFFERYVVARLDPRTDWADRLRAVHGVELTGDPCEPHLEVTKRFRRIEGKRIKEEDVAPFKEWEQARAARLEIEKREDALLAKCQAIAGDAEIVELPGVGEFTYKSQRGAPLINRAAMKEDGVYEKYAKENRVRVARLSKPKK